MRIILEVEDNKEGRALMQFLKQLSFVRIEETQKQRRKRLKFEEIFGLWRNRNITKEKLREKAWRM
jgi:hypothetical protein